MTGVVSLVSKEEIEEIVLVYKISMIFKVYPCDENQIVKNNCIIVYVE